MLFPVDIGGHVSASLELILHGCIVHLIILSLSAVEKCLLLSIIFIHTEMCKKEGQL